ncbi:MAG: hypothetical protein HC882_04600, partial [Acidobacteria bacterium]|nr:hypothetical protein [Acidobacteriota bacterium]
MTTGNAPSRGDAGRALRFPVVVFDLDGVLVDTERVNIAAATEAFATVGVKLHESDHSLIVGRHPLDYVPDLAQRHGLPPSIALRAQRLQTEAWTRLARDVPALAMSCRRSGNFARAVSGSREPGTSRGHGCGV